MDSDQIARLRSAITKLSRRLNATATHEGLTPAQASVLGVIVAQGPLGLSRLLEIEGIHPTMLSRVVGRLVAEGLITREPDPTDLRSVTVDAKPAGRRVHERIRAAKALMVSQCVARLTPEQETALVAALGALEDLAVELQRQADAERNAVGLT